MNKYLKEILLIILFQTKATHGQSSMNEFVNLQEFFHVATKVFKSSVSGSSFYYLLSAFCKLDEGLS
jgi:hypothetical protein